MNFKKLFTLATALVLTILVSSCASKLKPFEPNAAKVDPNPLELVGTQIPGQVSLTIPAKWFNKNAVVSITPELRFAGKSVTGSTITLQGEKVRDNYSVISYQRGGTQVIPFNFHYEDGMEQSQLYLSFRARINGNNVTLPALKVANGTVMTANLASISDVKAAIARDGFQRIIEEQYSADLKFLINRAEVRAKELNKIDIKEWKDVVENAYEIPNHEVDVEVQAYASPEGNVDFNEKLAAQREKNTTQTLSKQFGKKNIEINAHYTAEDWDGFQKLLEQSNIQDKDLVLRVLSMYQDPAEREREIRNLSHIFTQLADEILPELRRSRLNANVRIIGKSDDELKRFMAEKPGRLNIEEILYTATLYPEQSKRLSIYNTATQLYPKDYRAYNNLGTIYLANGDYQRAADFFTKAQSLQPNNAPTNMNQALLALREGDIQKAQQLMGTAVEVPEAGQGIGMLRMYEGKYADAAKSFGEAPSNSLAVAQIMQHNYADAARTLAAVAAPNAGTAYLKAVVAARTNDLNGIISHLKQAIALDRTLAIRAARDLEFAAFHSNPDFKAVIR